jgi:hypothetical protein
MSSGPELPVIYENPRFDKATPTLKPVVDRAVRFTGVILMEWGTLTLIEESPRYLKVATIVVAGLVLAVHESWPWLRMRDWRWYPSLMTTFVVGYFAIFAYALYTEPAHKSSSDEIVAAVIKALPPNTAQPMFAEAAMKRPPDPRTELIGGPYIASDIQRLIPVFFEINAALTRSAPVFREEQQMTSNWQAQLENTGSKAFVEKLQALAGKVVSARDVVNQIIEKNNADRNELSTAINSGTDAVDQNANEIGNLIANVQALAAIPIETQILVLSRDIRRLDNAALNYNGWVQGSISNVQTKIRRLRDYKP